MSSYGNFYNGFRDVLGYSGSDDTTRLTNDLNKLQTALDPTLGYSEIFAQEDALLEQRLQNARALERYKKQLFNEQLEFENKVQQKAQEARIAYEKKLYDKYLKEQEKQAKKRKGSKLTKDEIKAIQARVQQEYRVTEEAKKKLDKAAAKATKAELRKQSKSTQAEQAQNLSNIFKKGLTFSERASILKNNSTAASLITALANFTQSLKNNINTIAGYQSAVDTRLQGSRNKTIGGSYWDAISSDLTDVAAVSPLIKQEDLANSVRSLVGQGISFNVEQRAALNVLKDKIATTFDVTSASLTQLVRIQQADTSAARLGMESALTAFLNNMYETTEYMQSAAGQIRDSLLEAESLMGATGAATFEYQVQKWLGSLYSVGFSGTTSLASSLGKLAAGDISGISGNDSGNLLIMAANKAGLSVANILAKGIDESDTNLLLKSAVEYLAGLYNETKGNNVVAQQIAGVFGLTASDLKAAANLSNSTNTVSNQNISYGGMLNRLQSMANTMYKRTSYAELLSNSLSNMQYTMASNIASNPAVYATYMIASMLKDVTGGWEFSLPLVMGTGSTQTFNIADTMLTAALGHSIMSGIGSLISGGSAGGFSGSGILKTLGIGGNVSTISRGSGMGSTSSGTTVSSSAYIGNSSSSDVQNKSLTDTKDSVNKQVAGAVDESEETTMSDVNTSILSIYQLLQDVISGTKTFCVSMGSENSLLYSFRNSGGSL